MISERDLFCVHGPQTDRETDSRAGGESAGGLQCCLSCDSQTLGGEGDGWSQTQTPRHGSPPDIRHHNMTSPLGPHCSHRSGSPLSHEIVAYLVWR